MTLGEKLTRLRKENGYTQEELADILGVSRQAVGKWESDASYPETEKLIRLGELYDCSMDYLLKNSLESDEKPDGIARLRSFYFEKKSKKTIGGLPLWHINVGLGRTAKGIFAVGLCARGVVSLGLLSLGIFSFGCLSLGLFAIGALALGLIAAGSVAVGIFAFGAICVGIFTAGALAVGEFSFGAAAFGKYFASGDHARAAIAVGKTKATGSLFAASEITAENREEVFRLLDQSVPPLLSFLKEIVKRLL